VNLEASSGLRRASAASEIIIDCHGHYTTEPQELLDWRKRQVAAIGDRSQMPTIDSLEISDDSLRQSVEGAQTAFAAGTRDIADAVLAPRVRHEPSHRRRIRQPGMVEGFQRLDLSDDEALPEEFRRRMPAAAIPGGRTEKLYRGA